MNKFVSIIAVLVALTIITGVAVLIYTHWAIFSSIVTIAVLFLLGYFSILLLKAAANMKVF